MADADRSTGVRFGVAVITLALAVGATACRGVIPGAGGFEPTASETPKRSPGDGRSGPGDGLSEGPPPVTVSAGDVSLDLRAWTYCYGNVCADGFGPPDDVPSVGTASQVAIEFPVSGWTFEAEFVPVGDACPRRHSVPVQRTGEFTHLLAPAGPTDTYDVTLFGRGDGDLFVTFRWTTPTDGPMPVPGGRLAVLADHDGVVDSYGVELQLWNLAATPTSATAEITVTAADGNALAFEATRAPGCWSEGEIYWYGPDHSGLEAAKLGPGPFTYDVVVTLDGREYAATAMWPDDEIEGNEPSVALNFTPELPALR